jgi:hypothetical protein
MFAIGSDVDHSVSLTAYLEFMQYLNTTKNTVYGRGLDLEISNSFWFFNAEEDKQLSYFSGTSNQKSQFSHACRHLWASGHIDTLHSYGNFNAGGFQRAFAERALEELEKHGVTIPVWINHGNDQNHQKIGNYQAFHGAKPNQTAYHFDLLKKHGTRFFWAGRTSHVRGQSTTPQFGGNLERGIQNLFVRTKYRNVDRPMPDNANKLLMRTRLEDNNHFIEFQRFISRFGEVKNTDFLDLGRQLTKSNLSALIRREGYMVLYTHMNENLPKAKPLPLAAEKGLQLLKKSSLDKRLLVTTSSRLLTYADMTQNLAWTTEFHAGLTSLHLYRSDDYRLLPEDLQGLCLYCDHPNKISLYIDNKPLSLHINPPDINGRVSVSVPWVPLEYPL